MNIILPFVLVYLIAFLPINEKLYLQITFFYLFIIFSIIELSTSGDGYGYTLYYNTVNNIPDTISKGRLVDDLSTYRYYVEISFTFLISIFKTISETNLPLDFVNSQQLIMVSSAGLQSFFFYKSFRLINLNKILLSALLINYLGFCGIYFYLHYLRQGIATALVIYGLSIIFLTNKKKLFGITAIIFAGTFHIATFVTSFPVIFLINKFIKPKIIIYLFPIYLIYISLINNKLSFFTDIYTSIINWIIFIPSIRKYFLYYVIDYNQFDIATRTTRYSYQTIFAFFIWLLIVFYMIQSKINISKLKAIISDKGRNFTYGNSDDLLYFSYCGLSSLIILASFSSFIPVFTRSFFTFYFFIGLGIIVICLKEKMKILYPFLGLPGIILFIKIVSGSSFMQEIYLRVPKAFF